MKILVYSVIFCRTNRHCFLLCCIKDNKQLLFILLYLVSEYIFSHLIRWLNCVLKVQLFSVCLYAFAAFQTEYVRSLKWKQCWQKSFEFVNLYTVCIQYVFFCAFIGCQQSQNGRISLVCSFIEHLTQSNTINIPVGDEAMFNTEKIPRAQPGQFNSQRAEFNDHNVRNKFTFSSKELFCSTRTVQRAPEKMRKIKTLS